MHSEFVFKGVAVDLELASDLPSVLGNHIELQQVIMNLLIKAVDAMATQPTSSRHLYVATSCAEPTTVHALIRDSGPGIPLTSYHAFSNRSSPLRPQAGVWV